MPCPTAPRPVQMLLVAVVAAGCIPDLPQVDDPCGEWPEPGLFSYRVETPEKTRRAYVYVPASAGERDLVVVLHGAGSSATDIREVSEHTANADAEGYVAVFPQALRSVVPRAWNVGPCCGTVDEEHRDIDDVAFLDQLVAELAPQVCGGRVLATGHSNGAMMVNRWACEGGAVDGVVPAAGALLLDRCPGKPLPIRHYHGLADEIVPFEGGPSPRGDLWPPVEDGLAVWRERNRCDDSAPVTVTSGTVTCSSWSCEEAVELCTIEGWEHKWPGGIYSGALPAGIDATADSVDFLRGARIRDLVR